MSIQFTFQLIALESLVGFKWEKKEVDAIHTINRKNNNLEKCAGIGLNDFHIKWIIGTHCNWKNQNPGSRLGATRETALPIWPIWPNFEVNGLDWQCSLAGSSKTAPRIFIFSIVLGADCLSYLKSIETHARAFFKVIIFSIGSVNTFKLGGWCNAFKVGFVRATGLLIKLSYFGS